MDSPANRRPRAGPLLAGLAVVAALAAGCDHQSPVRSTSTVEPAGVVRGGIPPCTGPESSALHFVAGAVVALRGSITEHHIAPGEIKDVLPHREVARESVGEGGEYRFTLPPGHYVLRVVRSRLASELPFVAVKIVARHTVHIDMPDSCK